MADADPFAQFPDPGSPGLSRADAAAGVDVDEKAPAAPPADNPSVDGDDPFASFPTPAAPQGSATGAAARGFERGVVPAAGGLVGGGLGAEIGGAIGLLGGPAAGFTVPAGAVVGGLVGGYFGSQQAETLQNYGLSKAPDDFKETIGADDRQQRLDQEQHPYASFIGGIAPYAMTMKPGPLLGATLPANATAIQRLMANPVTARVFGGGLMGGMELGQEAASGEGPDWTKVAIATGMGVFLNRPNRIGEAVTEIGARPARALLPRNPGAPPTLAQLNDTNLMGEGVTEDTFQGENQRDPQTADAAQQTARVEQDMIGEREAPDLDALARKTEPELFAQYDELTAQRNAFRDQIARMSNPPDEDIAAAQATAQQAQEAVDAHIEANKGYAGGPEARRLRVNARTAQAAADEIAARRQAFEAGEGQETPELAAMRQQFQNVDFQLRDVGRDVAAARRRAGDQVGSGVIEPDAATIEPQTEARAADVATTDLQTTPIEQQRAAIQADVRQKLIAAGRPEDEATASAALVSARYETRAARFEGALGTPQELYNREGPGIQGPGGRRSTFDRSKVSSELNQSERPANENAPQIANANERPALEDGETLQSMIDDERETHALVHSRQFARLGGGDSRIQEVTERDNSLLHYLRGAVPEKWLAVEGWAAREPALLRLPEKSQDTLLRQMAHVETMLLPGGKYADEAIFDLRANSRIRREALRAREQYNTLREQAGLKKIGDGFNDPAWGWRFFGDDAPANRLPLAQDARNLVELNKFDPNKPLEELPSEEAASRVLRDVFPREYEQTKRGSIRFFENSTRPIITLAKDADASTFIHESGHQFLEEMLRDAKHPQAPDSLIADTATIRRYLKMGSDDAPATRQHEKFARGFEQYMREGIAPSPQLASVFSKFQNWLVKTYQTIKGLGAPINEDIRGVFDRMLSSEPQRTTIAPEHEAGPSLADIHEADAAHVEPAEAETAADRVAAERARHIEEQPREIAHEIAPLVAEHEAATAGTGAADAGGEAGVGDGGLPEVVGDRGEAGPLSGGGVVGADRGAQREGGTGPAAESGGVSGPNRRDLRSKLESPAPGPAEVYGPGDGTKFVDRAGNFRLDNVETSEDVKQALRDMAEANGDFLTERRNTLTDGQILNLSQALNMSYQDLAGRKLGQAFSAEEIKAAEKMLADTTKFAWDAMKKVNETGSDEDALAYAEAKSRQQLVQGQFSGVTAEAGRALRAMKKTQEFWTPETSATKDFLKDAANATGQTLYQLKMEAKLGKNLDSAAKVAKFLRDAQQRSYGRMLLEYWVNSLISGLATHTTYVIGGQILTLNKLGPETLIAAALGKMRDTEGRERVYAGESLASLQEYIRALPKATQALIEAAKTGQTTLLPGETAHPLTPFEGDTSIQIAKSITNDDVRWGEAKADAFGLFRGLKDGLLAGGALLKSGGVEGAPLFSAVHSPLGQIPDLAIKGVTIPFAPFGGTVSRLPSRGVAGLHSFQRTMNYSIENNAKAYRQAMNEMRAGTLNEANFDSRVAEIRQSPTPESMEASRGMATELTLMGNGGELINRISRVTNWAPKLPGLGETPILKFVDPFVKIAANIIDQSIVQRTPVGLISSELRADVMGKNGSIAQDTAQARMITGTAMSLAFGGLAAEGLMTGSGPSDPRKALVWRQAGYRAHSVRIGDLFYDIHRLGPLGMIAGIAADMYDVAGTASHGDLLQAGSMLMHAVTQNVLDESFMRGPAELIQAIEDPERYGQRYIQSMVSSFVPFSVGLSQMDRAIDPYTRQTRTVMDAIKQKIPGLSETLLPRRDVWGEPMPNMDALLHSGVTSIYESRVSADPVNKVMVQLGMGAAQVPRTIRNVKLTDQQYDDFARIAGRTIKQRLDAYVRSPDWRNFTPEHQRTVIEAEFKAGREAARGKMFGLYPQIVAQAHAQLTAKRGGQ